MTFQTPHKIVIVGGNFGGINLAHYLLLNTLPALKRKHPEFSYCVTLVSPNTHFFFKIGVPRAIVNPEQATNEKLFKPIAEAFSRYGNAFNYVNGKAVGVKASDKMLIAQSGDAQENIRYDSLVIAVGTTSTSPLWTLHDDHEKSQAAIQALNESLSNAKTVLVAGAGPVGVESAGEIASAHRGTQVTLVAPHERLLHHLKPDISEKARKTLEKLGVTVKVNTRVEEASAEADVNSIKLSDGSLEKPDVFVDATGPRTINTAWLPQQWLDDTGHLLTRDAYFRIRGSGTDTDSIYATGDVVSGSKKTAIEVDGMTPTVASSIAADIDKSLGGNPAVSGGFLGWLPFGRPAPFSQKEYSPMKDTVIIPIGPKGGVGQVLGWGAPSFIVKKGKAENFLLELIEPLISGKKWIDK